MWSYDVEEGAYVVMSDTYKVSSSYLKNTILSSLSVCEIIRLISHRYISPIGRLKLIVENEVIVNRSKS